MRTSFALLGLILVMVVMAFLNGQDITDDQTQATIYSSQDNLEASANAEGQETVVHAFNSLEWVLEDTNTVGEYIVETYQEYEIYTDENGTVIQELPTANFQYLRFRE
ncbi:hypothetical protein [Radiobacillus sp. PE A8.2]|uniref:hypothetical protein n=1 Tax=Radiobacillus sp. PE A8.2 TaxID=3380349 RepID=UPI00388F6768